MIEKVGCRQEMRGVTKAPLLIAPPHLGYTNYKYNTSLASASASSPCKMKKFKYMECLKNHAAAIGGRATDGCGEFMAAGEEGSLEALKCSACNCHRNFHRKIHMPMPMPQQGVEKVGEGRKRLRSKFSQDQKEKMQRFAEKSGWKIHKADDAELRTFCEEIGVNRKVLKVWMHNNKYNHIITTTSTS